MCLYPKLIDNRKYKMNKKNGGQVPPILDKRVLKVPVGCGKCIECMKQKARNWQVRLMEDIKEHKNGKFITLTFSPEGLKEIDREIKGAYGYVRDNEIMTLAMRRFLERWRKKYKKSVRHWFISELGHENTEHIHAHGILYTDASKEEIEKIWKYGKIWQGGYVNEKTINYLIKYVTKVDKKHEYYKPKVLTSAGIGRRYLDSINSNLNKYKGDKTIESYTTSNGYKIAMPTYWRNNIYNDEEREKLWLTMLDKQVRYVDGVKIDVSKGEDEYYKALKYARRKNKQFGYGNDEIDWEKKKYENSRRMIKIKEKIAKGK